MEVNNMLIVPKYELKKEIQMDPILEIEGTFSEKTLYLEPEKIGVEEYPNYWSNLITTIPCRRKSKG